MPPGTLELPAQRQDRRRPPTHFPRSKLTGKPAPSQPITVHHALTASRAPIKNEIPKSASVPRHVPRRRHCNPDRIPASSSRCPLFHLVYSQRPLTVIISRRKNNCPSNRQSRLSC